MILLDDSLLQPRSKRRQAWQQWGDNIDLSNEKPTI